jgi:DNA-binding Xre family transcriptional regulator
MSGYTPEAYSMLGAILARRNLSVLALQRELAKAGMSVNIKSLYRLADDAPVQKIDLHIAAAVCKACHVSLNDLIRFQKPKAQLRRLDSKTQSRLDALMARNNEGQLTAAERREFGVLADRAHRISIENARTLLAERRRAGKHVPAKRKPIAFKQTTLAA